MLAPGAEAAAHGTAKQPAGQTTNNAESGPNNLNHNGPRIEAETKPAAAVTQIWTKDQETPRKPGGLDRVWLRAADQREKPAMAIANPDLVSAMGFRGLCN